MLALADLAALERRHRDDKVLSVYLNGTFSNPAERDAWRLVLDGRIAEAREKAVGAGADERRLFDAAVQRLYDALPSTGELHASSGWVGYFLPDDAVLVEHLPVRMPDLVAWDQGIRIAPLFRTLKELNPVAVVVADSRAASLFRYMERQLQEVGVVEAETVIGPVYHMGDTPRSGFHAGVRGVTGTDEAERVTRAAKERLYREVVDRVLKLAGNQGWVVLGGTPEACKDLEAMLPGRLGARTIIDASLHRRSRNAEVAEAAARGAAELRARSDANHVELLAELAGGKGRGAVGLSATLRALRDHSVQTLLISSRMITEQPDLAESIVRLAFHQGAEIEHVPGVAAQRLDEQFDGVAARLRFVAENAEAI